MPRYIDADAVEKRIVDYYDAQLQSFPSSKGEEKRLLLGGINYGRNVVRDAPTADVAPKSEVENLKALLEMNEKAYDSLRELYKTDTDAFVEARRKTGVEVAREIFAEIEKLLDFNSLQGDIFTGKYFDVELEADIAELKKKYTEGENGTQ